MTRFAIGLLLVLLASAALAPAVERVRAQAPLPGSGSVTITGPVRVIEADTFEVTIQGRRVGIGIVGLIAPAGNTSCGRSAIKFIQNLVNQGIELHEDTNVPAFDAGYRRMYRIARRPNRASIAVALASAGMARADARAQRALEFTQITAAEADARLNRRGCVH